MPRVERGKSGLWIILYAASGFGKTTLAAALLKLLARTTGREGVYVDWDGSAEDIPGTVPMILWDPIPKDALGRPYTEPSKEHADAVERQAVEAMLEALKVKAPVFVADTVTMLGRRLFHALPRPMAGEKGRDMRPVYGEAQLRVYQWALRMNELQKAGTHVLWICHEAISEVTDVDGKIKEIKGGPEVVSSKLIKTVPAFGRLVLRINTIPSGPTGVTRILQTDTDGFYIAKDRLNAFHPGGVPIGVSPYQADGKTPKPAEVFEDDCLKMGERVWRTIFKALERKQGNGTSKPEATTSDVKPAATGGADKTA